ncbi:MAG TPA: hypothetical protein VF884_06755 [Nitrososphaeraceae archaeon]
MDQRTSKRICEAISPVKQGQDKGPLSEEQAAFLRIQKGVLQKKQGLYAA